MELWECCSPAIEYGKFFLFTRLYSANTIMILPLYAPTVRNTLYCLQKAGKKDTELQMLTSQILPENSSSVLPVKQQRCCCQCPIYYGDLHSFIFFFYFLSSRAISIHFAHHFSKHFFFFKHFTLSPDPWCKVRCLHIHQCNIPAVLPTTAHIQNKNAIYFQIHMLYLHNARIYK